MHASGRRTRRATEPSIVQEPGYRRRTLSHRKIDRGRSDDRRVQREQQVESIGQTGGGSVMAAPRVVHEAAPAYLTPKTRRLSTACCSCSTPAWTPSTMDTPLALSWPYSWTTMVRIMSCRPPMPPQPMTTQVTFPEESSRWVASLRRTLT